MPLNSTHCTFKQVTMTALNINVRDQVINRLCGLGFLDTQMTLNEYVGFFLHLKSQAVVSSAPPPRARPSTRATDTRGSLR